MKKVKIAIIGAGSAGLSARREVAKVTDDYVVINSGPLGTTCARVGCMPSKVLIQAANDFHRRHKFLEQGIFGSDSLSIDTTKTMKHVRSLRDRFVRGVTNDMQSWTGKHLISKKAKLIGKNEIDCEGEIIFAEKIILAAGSRPTVPAVLENVKDFLITTDEIFEQEQLPGSVLVLGLGVIGLELGQALSRLGIKVHGVTRSRRLAGISDPKLNDYVIEKMSEEFPIHFGGIKSVRENGSQLDIEVENSNFSVDKILLASGRRSNLDQLNLESLNINLNEYGFPEFDKTTFQLKDAQNIFIAGDLTGEKQILHEASDEGKIVGFNAVNDMKGFKSRTPLTITFSDPNIAEVGQGYGALEKSGAEFEIGEVSFEGQGRSIVKLKEKGMLRVYGDRSSGKLLGAEMFGPECEHIAHLLSWVIEQNLTVNEVLSFPFYHPVIEEGLRTALRDLRSKVQQVQPDLEVFQIKE